MMAVSKYKKTKNIMRPRMTCIIGGKCRDGVTLIADKKISNPVTGAFEFREKLFIFQKENFYYPIVIGFSGTVPLYEKFKREAMETLEKINPPTFSPMNFTESFNISVSGTIYPYSLGTSRQVILHPYLEELENLIKKYKNQYRNERFDVLFAAQVKFRGADLHYISDSGLSEDVDKHKTIGSGETPANVILNILNPAQMYMKEFAKWGYFIIKHIEEYGIDD